MGKITLRIVPQNIRKIFVYFLCQLTETIVDVIRNRKKTKIYFVFGL